MCGRSMLIVDGYVLAVQGQACVDADVPWIPERGVPESFYDEQGGDRAHWTAPRLEWVAARLNRRPTDPVAAWIAVGVLGFMGYAVWKLL